MLLPLLLLFLRLRREQPEAFRFEDPMFEKNYNMFQAYANSKLALLMFAEELQHRLTKEKSNVIVNSANPGKRGIITSSPAEDIEKFAWDCNVYRDTMPRPRANLSRVCDEGAKQRSTCICWTQSVLSD